MSDFEVRNAEIGELLKDIGGLIGGALPKEYGFALLINSYGEGGETFYISNCQRDDMIKLLQETKEKLEGGDGQA